MKASFLTGIMILSSLLGTASAQQTNPDSLTVKIPTFIRLYPFELMTRPRELRAGVEVGITPTQSLVIDGSYFKTQEDRDLGPGWAIKVDYRIYSDNTNSRWRAFAGPNLMIKKTEYIQRRHYRYEEDVRTVAAVNLKGGFDVRLSRTGRARFEMFAGLGVRYQSNAINLKMGDKAKYTGHPGYSPNVLFGAVLKL